MTGRRPGPRRSQVTSRRTQLGMCGHIVAMCPAGGGVTHHVLAPFARTFLMSGLLFWEQPQARLAQIGAALLGSNERVEHDFPDLLRGAAGDRELGSPLQRLLA